MSIREAVVVEALRTPIGKLKGALSSLDAYRLGEVVIRGTVSRGRFDPGIVDDVIMGNLLALPGNVARVAALEAGLPEKVPALTVDRQCASGLDAITLAAAKIAAGEGDVYIAGGMENMTRSPYWLEKAEKPFSPGPPKFLPAMLSPPSIGDPNMVQTAVNLEKEFGISRADQDAFALRSQQLAKAALDKGFYTDQIVPLTVPIGRGGNVIFKDDESPRPETTLEALTGLKSLIGGESGVTAGNSCPMNDGAAALLVMEKEKAIALGYKDGLLVKAWGVAGLSPERMGLGPVFAVKKLLERTGYALDDFDIVELNEAFAVQVLACLKELRIDMDRLNPNGGAIALGHPWVRQGPYLR